jgi:2-(1,2-epoxy-1,2-dihydrophenyl)acetyl-CoA isomerase
MGLTLQKQQSVATIMLDRPEKRNALLPEMWGRFAEFLDDIEADAEMRAVILTGAGGAFCSGADLSVMQRRTPEAAHRRLDLLHRQMIRFYNFSKPTIAAVDGPAVGLGWSLALCCDLTIVTPRARFCQIFLNHGLSPDGGSVHLLRNAVGMARAKEIVYSARFVGAEEALSLGLAVALVSPEDLLREADALARRIANAPALALTLTKRLFHGDASSYEEHLRQELLTTPILLHSDDYATRLEHRHRPRGSNPAAFGGSCANPDL